jgi:hypothetical protein
MIKERIKEQTRTQKLGPSHYKRMKGFENKLIKLQDLFIDGEMDSNDYRQAKTRYEIILSELKR